MKTAHNSKHVISHQRVSQFVCDVFPDTHKKRIESIANATNGILHSTSLAIHAIGAGLAFARGLVPKHATKQIDRLLSNFKLDVETLAWDWVPFLLGDRAEAVVALDWTDFDADDHSTLALHLISNHGRSSMLLAKTVTKSDIKGMRNIHEDTMLSTFADIVQKRVKITVLADRGFADQRFFEWITQLGFDFIIRFRKNTLVEDSNGIQREVSDWLLPSRRPCKLTNPRITADRFQIGAVVSVWDQDMNEPWFLASSLADFESRRIINLYARRFTIEEAFRDSKDLRFGLGLSSTHIKDTARRDRLLFLCAIALALLTLLGAASEATGLDKKLKTNTSKLRTHSLFKQGLYWYSCIPTMRDEWLIPLLQKFALLVAEQPFANQTFGVL